MRACVFISCNKYCGQQQQDEMETRPRVSTFVSSLVNYENTIPANTDPDAKPAAPAARMGKFFHQTETKNINK